MTRDFKNLNSKIKNYLCYWKLLFFSIVQLCRFEYHEDMIAHMKAYSG